MLLRRARISCFRRFTDGRGAKALYYACSFCVPGFFLLSGYLVAGKTAVTLDYSESKIIAIMKKLFGWVIFWISVHFIRTGELYDIWTNTSQAVISSGIEPVAWYLFTYCLLMIFAPLLFWVLKRFPTMFCICSVGWMIILTTGYFNFIRDTRTQSLWLHLYAGYFVLGMTCAYLYSHMPEKGRKISLLLSLLLFIFASEVYYHIAIIEESVGAPHENYGTWYYSIWLVSLFIVTLSIQNVPGAIEDILKGMSKNTFVTYMGHLPILIYVTSIRPLQSLSSAIVCIIGLFAVTQIMAEIFNKLPLLRKIT